MKRLSTGVVLSLAAATAIVVLGVIAIPAPLKLVMAQNLERRLAGLRLGGVRVEEQGLEIVYLAGGEGEPMLLLHGFGADKDHWTRFARHLTDDFRIVAPDLPGFGESSRDASLDYSPAAQVERLDAIADALGLERFHLGGNSMGGMLAGLYAAAHPERVQSVLLFAPAGVTRAKPSELQRAMDEGRNPLLVRSAAEFASLLDFVFVDPPWVPSSILDFLAARAVADRPLHEKILADWLGGQTPLEDALAGVEAPVLVVWGDHDRLLDVSGADVLRETRPGAEVVILENVGHVPMVERPEESADAVRRFLRPQLAAPSSR
jgi:abhydrolase domain-containing protein 6